MTEDAGEALLRLLALMARLRDPRDGCPWDLKQTFATIAPYTIEEAYEVADAIDAGDPQHLRDELGDLLFQVVFHARMAEERGWFDFADVASAIRDKLDAPASAHLRRCQPCRRGLGARMGGAEGAGARPERAGQRCAQHGAVRGTEGTAGAAARGEARQARRAGGL